MRRQTKELSPDPVDGSGNLSPMPDSSLAAFSSCRIRLPNGTALEVSGTLSAGLIGQLLQVAGALPLVAGGSVR
ncbi:MAG: hypothetical protein HQL93_01495 [Magnetococcales bacterium]|nr:hypothetical protein [Magnetococcales bacterium]